MRQDTLSTRRIKAVSLSFDQPLISSVYDESLAFFGEQRHGAERKRKNRDNANQMSLIPPPEWR